MTIIPATTADPHARRSDPSSSHVAVAAIAANGTLRDNILAAAAKLAPAVFDDSDLQLVIEQLTDRRQQRNVISRSRGLMEREGLFVRVGPRERGDRITVHFRLPHPGELPLDAGRARAVHYRQLAGVHLCTSHDVVHRGLSTRCGIGFTRDEPCNMTELYTKEA